MIKAETCIIFLKENKLLINYSILEIFNVYRTTIHDPEQRPRIVNKVSDHYDFIIVGMS